MMLQCHQTFNTDRTHITDISQFHSKRNFTLTVHAASKISSCKVKTGWVIASAVSFNSFQTLILMNHLHFLKFIYFENLYIISKQIDEGLIYSHIKYLFLNETFYVGFHPIVNNHQINFSTKEKNQSINILTKQSIFYLFLKNVMN